MNSERKITQKEHGLGIKPYVLLFMLFTIHCSLITFVYAQSPQQEYEKMQRDIRKQSKKLASVKKTEQNVLDELRKTTAELNEIEKQLTSQRGKIKKIQQTINALDADIINKKEGINKQDALLRKRLLALQKLSKENDALLILISSEDISQTARIFRYLQDISGYDHKIINKYKEDVAILSEKQAQFKKLSDELRVEEGKLTKLETSVKEKKKQRESLLVSVRKEKIHYERMISDLKESSNRLLRIIQQSEKEEAEKRKKREKTKKPGASTPQKKEEEPTEDSAFARLKGRLPWPAAGTVAIQYGSQVDPLFNLPVFRSGIHIKTALGTSVRSVHEGTVVFADDFKGYNKLVIVSHGNGYHTLYGNLNRIFLKNGVIIKDSESIGEVGESSALGTSGLYFEIRYKGKPLDPQQWLKK